MQDMDDDKVLDDGLTESEAEFLVEDIDEHASQKISPLKNSDLKMKFNQPEQFVAGMKKNDAIRKQ